MGIGKRHYASRSVFIEQPGRHGAQTIRDEFLVIWIYCRVVYVLNCVEIALGEVHGWIGRISRA